MIIIVLIDKNNIFASRCTKAPIPTPSLTNIHFIIKNSHIGMLFNLCVKPSTSAVSTAIIHTYHLIKRGVKWLLPNAVKAFRQIMCQSVIHWYDY